MENPHKFFHALPQAPLGLPASFAGTVQRRASPANGGMAQRATRGRTMCGWVGCFMRAPALLVYIRQKIRNYEFYKSAHAQGRGPVPR